MRHREEMKEELMLERKKWETEITDIKTKRDMEVE